MIGNIVMLIIGLAMGGVVVWIIFNTILRSERKAADEKVNLLNDARKSLTDTFNALSSEALKNNNKSFLDLAQTKLGIFQESAKGDPENRRQSIDHLVQPLQNSLETMNRKIADIETARTSAYATLTQQVASMVTAQAQLQTETANLVKALRAPQVRGRWGEIQLRSVVELAGMLDHCDFKQQESVTTEEGRLRPDPFRFDCVCDSPLSIARLCRGKAGLMDAE